MKITINRDNLIPDDNWQVFHKVRAIIENENGEFIISKEGGKYIFPGGKREKNETNIEAIKREIKEETGIILNNDDFIEKLELETLYKDFYDFRSDSLKPRYTSTIYYYAKCSNNIDTSKMCLTDGEIKEGFKVAFVNQDRLIEMLEEDHSQATNGVFFDEENRIVMDNILKDILFNERKTIMEGNMEDKLRHFRIAVYCGLEFNDALINGVKEQSIEPDGYDESYINITNEDYERNALNFVLNTESKDKTKDLKIANAFIFEGDELLSGLEINKYGVDLGKNPLTVFHDASEMQKIIETYSETKRK